MDNNPAGASRHTQHDLFDFSDDYEDEYEEILNFLAISRVNRLPLIKKDLTSARRPLTDQPFSAVFRSYADSSRLTNCSGRKFAMSSLNCRLSRSLRSRACRVTFYLEIGVEFTSFHVAPALFNDLQTVLIDTEAPLKVSNSTCNSVMYQSDRCLRRTFFRNYM